MSRSNENEKVRKKLKEIIKLGTCITLIETSVNKSLLVSDALKKRKVIKITDEYKIEFDCIVYDTGYWRHPAFLLYNASFSLVKKSKNIYILTVGHKRSTYFVYKLECR